MQLHISFIYILLGISVTEYESYKVSFTSKSTQMSAFGELCILRKFDFSLSLECWKLETSRVKNFTRNFGHSNP